MSKVKKFLMVIFGLVMVFGLVSCYIDNPPTPVECTEHVDENKDGKCDVCEKEVEIETSKVVRVSGSSLSNNLLAYNANKGEQTNKRTEFMELNKTYVVGDDNSWSAKPRVSFVLFDPSDGTVEPTGDQEWTYQIKLYVLESGEYNLIANDNKTYVDSVDVKNCTIDFATGAIGNSFRVEVVPDGLTAAQQQNVSQYTTTFNFDVVDGYNAYTALDLAYIDNRQQGDEYATGWKAFKEEKGLDPLYEPEAVILHSDIKVTANDLPAIFFYQESEVSSADADYRRGVVGSLKDFTNMYVRNLAEGENFALIGNYFTLDNSTIREVMRDRGEITPEGKVISHATLIRFEGHATAKATMENLSIIGNAPRVEDAIKAGGQILVKVEGPQYHAYNNITICTFITYFANRTDAEFMMEKCKVYDAFNSFVYNWGSPDVHIVSCEMIGAGGPIIIQDHVGNKSVDGGQPATTIIETSRLESYVTGSEGWFDVVNATALVPGILALNNLFNNPLAPLASFLKTSSTDSERQYMNLIVVNKAGSGDTVSSEKIKGTVVIDNVYYDYGAHDNPYLAAMLDATYQNGAPAFQTTAGGFAYTDGATGLFDISNQLITDPNNPIFDGKYITIYYQGMSFVLEFFEPNQTYTPE